MSPHETQHMLHHADIADVGAKFAELQFFLQQKAKSTTK